MIRTSSDWIDSDVRTRRDRLRTDDSRYLEGKDSGSVFLSRTKPIYLVVCPPY